MLDTARSILKTAAEAKCDILLPVDARVSKEFKAHAPNRVVSVDDIAADEMMLDIGPLSVTEVEKKLGTAKTLVWNGPFGAFEIPPFDLSLIHI